MMIATYKGRDANCKCAVATKLYKGHKGASIRTYGLRKPDKPKNEQDFVVLTQEQVKLLIKQLRMAIK